MPARRAVVPTAAPSTEVTIGPHERLLVIAPHPDDETIAAGGLIQRVRERGGDIRIVLVTAGDGYTEAVKYETRRPNPRPSEFIAYGEKRMHEARAAVRLLAGDKGRLLLLGFPDGGLDGLLRAHWWRGSPEKSLTTGATDPPYDEAVEPDLPYDGDDLRRELGHVVQEMKPTIVVLPDPLDHHPDHRAAGLFSLLAVNDWVVGLPAGTPRPRVFSYLVHWPGWPTGWSGGSPPPIDAPLELPEAMHNGDRRSVSFELTNEELATKREALNGYATQQKVLGLFLTAFVRRNEVFVALPGSELQSVETLVEQGLKGLEKSRRREQ